MSRIGELDRGGRWRTAVAGLTAATLATPGYLGRPPSSPDHAALPTPPDSRYAREVAERAREELSSPVLAHSLRCWHYSLRFADVDGLVVDPEQAWAAALLHDLALGASDVPGYGCFAALSADRAAELVARHRRTPDVEQVREAIAKHFEPFPASGAHARCLQSAVNADVVGYRLGELSPGVVAAIETGFPRDGFREAFTAALRTENRLRPHSTAAVLWRSGARLPMLLNPLERF